MQIKNLKNKLFRRNMVFIFQLKVCLTHECTFKFTKFVLRCPRPRPRHLAPLRSASLPVGAPRLPARRPNALRAAQQIIIVLLLFPKCLSCNDLRHHDKCNDIWDCNGQVQEVRHVKDGAEIFNHSASKISHKQACVVELHASFSEQV